MIRQRGRHLLLVCGMVCATVGVSVSAAPSTATAAISTRPIRIMPLGDSITYGTGSSTHSSYRAALWNRLVDQAGLNIDFVGSQHSGALPDTDNEGHRGWRIDRIAAHVDAWLAISRPDVILLHIGTNDMRENYQVSTAPQRLGALLDRIHADRPSASILVAQLVASADPAIEARIVTFNAALPGVVATRGSKIHLVDMSAFPSTTDVSASTTVSASTAASTSTAAPTSTAASTSPDLHDLLHPNDAGYAWMATRWYAALEPVIGGGRDWPLFTDGFDIGENPTTWQDSASAVAGVGGFCCGLTTMEASVRTEGISHGGASALLYSGSDVSATQSYAYAKLFAVNIPLTTRSELSYWIYPQQTAGTYVAVDFEFTDGGDLRDSGVVDQYGVPVHPQYQGEGGHLVPNTWNLIRVDLSALAGRTVSRIDLGFDRPESTGTFRGYLDDLSIADTTAAYPGMNLALHAATAASTPCSPFETPDRAVDGVTAGNSKWCSGVPHAALEVDLGAVHTIRRFVVRGAAAGGESQVWNTRAYRIALSIDGARWKTVATVAENVDAVTVNTIAPTVARYARLTIVRPSQSGDPQARIYEFEVDGA